MCAVEGGSGGRHRTQATIVSRTSETQAIAQETAKSNPVVDVDNERRATCCVAQKELIEPQGIVETYIRKIRPCLKKELDWFKQHATLSAAISDAALAVTSKGRRHPHQGRIPKAVLQTACRVLLKNEQAIAQCKNFDELHALLEKLLAPIKGVGELYVYDVALRIGAKLGVSPNKVYLHAGTRQGAKALGLNSKAKALEIAQLPAWLQELKPYEIEDVLCIFKDQLTKVKEQEVQ